MIVTTTQETDMTLVKTNDLKKGDRVLLNNGWYATIQDNRKGDTRMATVEGYYTETGSVYAHDIVEANIADSWIRVSHTPKQEQMRERVKNFGF
jgi:preprotein translocase subunit YajC